MSNLHTSRFGAMRSSFTYEELARDLAKLQPRLNQLTEDWLDARKLHGDESPQEHAIWWHLNSAELAKCRILREARRLDEINAVPA
ncbi:hypothetical protein SEA_PAOLA_89 [Mycobacterium phage Paola]|uniref:Uncharacterized protein n=2 Tax=Kratiovirus TaxID=2948788 RepID=A0A345M9B9_9CAUD|nr:hypothetical protein I5G74_gp08 [Mycobacterium phage Paola]YP_009951081.1 hypothetical protein I5G76_gp09 [Mycobacterium phage Thyatira]ASR85877.1 hypothetical protein SEA_GUILLSMINGER_90 [Mycobacterium phage Guillsminger]QXN73835.1 hypothetical protein SEA_SOSEPH_92 [Mycobacterium phage SoSeph]WNM65562.1 hypothetical protein SEA_HEFTYBOY_92 [Mycobacterium phage Heftyboy]AVO25875.1 hypothetical protein SEA_PAOLA_89 [Mycobacterium phage Paola]AXH67090.1 hypothetical protein SEA_THYATIRA_92 